MGEEAEKKSNRKVQRTEIKYFNKKKEKKRNYNQQLSKSIETNRSGEITRSTTATRTRTHTHRTYPHNFPNEQCSANANPFSHFGRTNFFPLLLFGCSCCCRCCLERITFGGEGDSEQTSKNLRKNLINANRIVSRWRHDHIPCSVSQDK